MDVHLRPSGYGGQPSRPLATAALPTVASERSERLAKVGGEAGIRTLDTGFGPYNGLANHRLQPLGHLTAAVSLSIRQPASYKTADLVWIVPEIVPVSADIDGIGSDRSHFLAASRKVAVLP